jgi:hypothetical protein
MKSNSDMPIKLAGTYMLCDPCQRVLARLKTAAGIWHGPKPELFAFSTRTNTWTGAHHTDVGSLLHYAENGCYICNTLHGAIPRQLRDRAGYARSFYDIRASGQQRWTLRLTMELAAPDAEVQVVECHGIFKVLPEHGMLYPEATVDFTHRFFRFI